MLIAAWFCTKSYILCISCRVDHSFPFTRNFKRVSMGTFATNVFAISYKQSLRLLAGFFSHYRSSQLEVSLRKCVLKICSKRKGKGPCWKVISTWKFSFKSCFDMWHVCSPVNLFLCGYKKIQRLYFFSIRFSFTDTDDSQDRRGREGTIFYSTLPLPLAHEHSDIYLQLCMWDDYHIFLISMLVFTRLLLDEILPLYRITIWLPFDCRITISPYCCSDQWGNHTKILLTSLFVFLVSAEGN